MHKKLFATILCCLVAASFLTPSAFGQQHRSWNQTGAGTFSWHTSGNWTPSGAPGTFDDARITNSLTAGSQTITNMFGGGTSATINYLEMYNSAANANTVTLITAAGGTIQYGVNLGRGAIYSVGNDLRWGIDQFVNFDLRFGGNPATLIVSNGATIFLNSGGVKTLVNAGTIQFTAITGQVSQINYGQTPSFTNASNGTIVKLGVGTGSFVGEFGGANRPFYNAGTILVQGGAMVFDPRDAFADGGFRNLSTGFIQIDTASTGIINRTTSAWDGSAPPVNLGTINMAGGVLRTFAGGAAAVARVISNAPGGRILGHGTLDFNLANMGVVEARDGTLTLGRITGGVAPAGSSWVSTNFGGVASVLNFGAFAGGGLFDLGAATLVNTGGGIRVVGGANLTLSTGYRANFGTINFAGAGLILMPNVAGLTALTNALTVVKTGAGASTITTGYGPLDPGNYAFINLGVVSNAGGGATLTINTGNAFAIGLSNAPGAALVLSTSGGHLQYRRTAEAWDGGDVPVNLGTIGIVPGGVTGTVSLLRGDLVTPTQFIRNEGLIESRIVGLTPGLHTWNMSVTNTAAGSVVVSNALARNLRFVGPNAGTVRLFSGSTLELGVPFLTNAGTVDLRGGVLVFTNVAGGDAFRNLAGGLITNVTGSGTLQLGHGVGENNYSLVNLGSIVASAGILTINSSNAFANGGFSNAASGRVVIDSGATLRIQRTVEAWTGTDPAAVNVGVITLGGGSLETFDGALNSARFIRNVGTITGFGTVSAQILNPGGEVIASGGLLVIANPLGTIVTNSAAGTYRAAGTGLRFNTGPDTGISNDFVNLGRFDFSSGTIAVGNFVNVGVFNAAHSAVGTIFASPIGLFTNAAAGRIFVSSGTSLVARTTVNLGVIDTYGAGAFGVTDGFNFTNAVGGLIINTNAAAALAIRAAGDRFFNLGTMVVSNSGTITMLNNVFTGTGWRNEGSVLLGNPASDGVLNSGTIDNVGTISGRGTINLQAGTPHTPRPFIQGAGGQLIVTNGDLTITHLSLSRLSIGGGTLLVSGGNTLRIFGDLAAATNAILLNSANVRLDGGRIISANVTNNPTGTIRGFGTLSFNIGPLAGSVSNLHNIGTIFASDPGSPLVLDGALVFNVTSGVVRADSGRLLVMGALTNAGTVTFISSLGTFSGDVTSPGFWTLTSSTNILGTVLRKAVGGRLSGDGLITGGSIANAGELVATNGVLRLESLVSGAGAYSAVAGVGAATLTFAGGGSISALFNTGATIRVTSVLTNDSLFVNAGTLVVDGGTYQNLGGITNLAASLLNIINNSRLGIGGLLVNAAGGTVSITSGTVSGTSVTNLGTMAFISSVGTFAGSVFNDGVWTLNPSTNTIAGGLTIAGIRNLTNSVDIIGGSLSVLAGGTYSLLATSRVTVAGAFTNAGSVALLDSSIGTFSGAAVNTGFYQSTNSTTLFASSLRNAATGTMTFADQSRLTVSGIFTNLGTVTFLNSVGTFNSAVVNFGSWITDPTTNVYTDNLINDTTGVIVMDAGDVFIFTNDADSVGNFLNRSTNNVANDMGKGKFLFSGTLALTQELHTAGHDMHQAYATTPTNVIDAAFAPPGYSTNFALGTLEISNFSTVRVFDAFIAGGIGTNDGLRAALYVTNLFMAANSFLIISSNVSVYFINSNAWGAANFELLGGPVLANMGQLHQFSPLTVIPEPSVVFLWLCGFLSIYGARRRSRRLNK